LALLEGSLLLKECPLSGRQCDLMTEWSVYPHNRQVNKYNQSAHKKGKSKINNTKREKQIPPKDEPLSIALCLRAAYGGFSEDWSSG
jgi:hypothetical protein